MLIVEEEVAQVVQEGLFLHAHTVIAGAASQLIAAETTN